MNSQHTPALAVAQIEQLLRRARETRRLSLLRRDRTAG
jgi:hypothetical protein